MLTSTGIDPPVDGIIIRIVEVKRCVVEVFIVGQKIGYP